MSTKIITAKAFSCAIDVDESGKIVRVPRFLNNFLNLPLSILEQSLKKNKFQSYKIEDVNEI
jgi:hypothetical protein